MIELELETEDGTIAIDEAVLASITDADLRLFRISRQELHRVFVEGVEVNAFRATLCESATLCF
jgi:hypothetical protein